MVTFDPFKCQYNVYNPNSEENEQSDGMTLGGKKLPKLNEDLYYGNEKNFSRTTFVLLDTDLPTGNTDQQIEKSDEENFDSRIY